MAARSGLTLQEPLRVVVQAAVDDFMRGRGLRSPQISAVLDYVESTGRKLEVFLSALSRRDDVAFVARSAIERQIKADRLPPCSEDLHGNNLRSLEGSLWAALEAMKVTHATMSSCNEGWTRDRHLHQLISKLVDAVEASGQRVTASKSELQVAPFVRFLKCLLDDVLGVTPSITTPTLGDTINEIRKEKRALNPSRGEEPPKLRRKKPRQTGASRETVTSQAASTAVSKEVRNVGCKRKQRVTV